MDTVKPRDGQKEKPVVKTPFGTITRRNFVKAAAATAATAGIAGGLLGCASNDENQSSGGAAKQDEWIPSMCNMCFNHCSILGHVVDGKLVEIKGDDRSPAGWGHLCGKGTAGIMQLYDPNRITVPLRRTSPNKGIGIDPQWEEITWDEAYDEILAKLDEQKEKNKPVVVFALITSIISWIDSMTWLGTQAGVATRHGTSIDAKFFAESRVNGCKLVDFDPHMSASAEQADEWVPIRPGTDAAVALAMANLLVNEYGIYDEEFLSNRTNGPALVNPETKRIVRDASSNKSLYWDTVDNTAKPYDKCDKPALEGDFEVDGVKVRTAFTLFKEHVAKYTPEYAEEITTVPADTTRRIAKEFGEAACIGQTEVVDGIEVPYRPVAVDTFSGIARHKHGFITHWAILQLNNIVGSTFARGGYLGYYTANNYGF